MNHKQAIEKVGSIVVSPISGSMRPLIRENIDFARFETVEKVPPKVGDVVLYPGYDSHEGKTIMHRIVGEERDSFIIRGDNAKRYEIVPKAEVFAVMTDYFRGDHCRSCKNPVFLLYKSYIVLLRRFEYDYRTSDMFFFKAVRYVWRKILH